MTGTCFEFYSYFSKLRTQKQKQCEQFMPKMEITALARGTATAPSILARTIETYLASVLVKAKNTKFRTKKKLARDARKNRRGQTVKHQIAVTTAKTLKCSKATSALYTFFF